ncbi:DNA polymerase III subunit delta [Legionella rowbothamii]|uniref:DNA polymerase III subunit delta n=1 Tax=Legionella rowbothamii TaxID=96229 RepID=UPI001054188C|nr:DNA polymerase III subunit delta [Legionella rowbothamii]
MQIKQQMLAQQLQKKIAPFYMLIGQDTYLLDDSLSTIKTAIKKDYECDEKLISIQSADDWNNVLEEANSYSLFSDAILLNIYFDKKSLDATGKKIITSYLNSVNTRCFIIIRAPNIPAKQLQWLASHEQVVLSVAYPLNPANMKSWIATQLRANAFSFDPLVPEVIHHYTQGNMLACAQVIEKLILTYAPNDKISVQQAQEQLSDQCDHNLFELTEACLLGNAAQAIPILRHAANNKTEATLILWMLAQEVRLMLQLTHLLQQQVDIKSACSQLKIWPQRFSHYQAAGKRLNRAELQRLHQYCYLIDERIKSSFSSQIWNALENLALSLCLGKLVGDTWSI